MKTEWKVTVDTAPNLTGPDEVIIAAAWFFHSVALEGRIIMKKIMINVLLNTQKIAFVILVALIGGLVMFTNYSDAYGSESVSTVIPAAITYCDASASLKANELNQNPEVQNDIK